MANNSIDKYIKEENSKYRIIMETSTRADSALVLATMALEHSGSGSYSAAMLLLSMENGKGFDFRELLSLDTTNRAHADIVIMGFKAHDYWPSNWMIEIGEDGKKIMSDLKNKFNDRG